VEVTQGKNVTDVAKALRVQHLIFSSLLHVKNTTKGRLAHVPHFDGKAEVEQYIRDSGVPAAFYLPGYFMSNLEMMIRPSEDGVLTWALPVGEEAKFPLVDIKADTGGSSIFLIYTPSEDAKRNYLLTQVRGKFIVGILRNRDSLLGTHILGATDYYTPKQILDTISSVTKKPTRYVQVSGDVYKSFLPEFMAQEMLENHLFIENPGYYGGDDLEKSHAILAEKLTSYEEYLKRTSAFKQ